MKKTIYEYRNYKQFLIDWLDGMPEGSRGQRKALSEAVGCQVSHISNVLSGSAHLSPEQAEASARHLGLNKDETEFLLNLVQLARAGTRSLKALYERILEDKQMQADSLKNRLRMPKSLSEVDESRYYSSWQFGAVHVLLSIPEFQSREALADKLKISLERVSEILEFLEGAGLCEKNGNKYQITQNQVHLDRDSNLISKHHMNWRLKTMGSLEQIEKTDLHYSAVLTLSAEDYEKISEILKKSLSDTLKVVTSSPEQQAAVICLDLYKL